MTASKTVSVKTPAEPKCVSLARALISAGAQAEAVAAARAAELRDSHLALCVETDPERAARAAEDVARLEVLAQVAARSRAVVVGNINAVAAEVVSLVSTAAEALRVALEAGGDAARRKATADLEPYFNRDCLPAAVQLSKVMQDYARWTAQHQPPSNLGVRRLGGGCDAAGTPLPDRIVVQSLSALVRAYDDVQSNLAEARKRAGIGAS